MFRAKNATKIGKTSFKAGQPVLYIDTAKTSTLEGASTQAYATGGPGNTRLITWDGEKSLTFTVEDALLSPMGFAILSGAGLFQGSEKVQKIHFHMSTSAIIDATGKIDLSDALSTGDEICADAPLYVMPIEEDGSITGEVYASAAIDTANKQALTGLTANANKAVMVDYYVIKDAAKVSELQITADKFAGSYYVEADTLFRDQATGKDLPANITLPNVKIQSSFTFSMSSSGDPSTFTFTMDAMPGYTYFNKAKKVLCAMQIANPDALTAEEDIDSVFPHAEGESFEESKEDSIVPAGEGA